MTVEENSLNKSLHKIELWLIKVIPFIMAFIYFLNTVLSCFNIDEEVEAILGKYGVTVENGQLDDCAYVGDMCKADFLKSSVPDELHLALYIQNVIDDVDAPDGLVFNRWYADMCYKGIAIDWEDMI